jgi:hypothetical protein
MTEDEIETRARKFFSDEEWDAMFSDQVIGEYLEDMLDHYEGDSAECLHHLNIISSVCDDIAEHASEGATLADLFKIVFEIKYTAVLICRELGKPASRKLH